MSASGPDRFHLRVVTSRSLLVEADVDEVQIPTIDGLIGVFPQHRPLIAALGRGVLTYRQGKYEERFPIEGGYAEVGPEAVTVFTESTEEEPA